MTSQFSFFGMIYFAVASFALIMSSAARSNVALFLVAAAPYIFAMIMIANPREICLWAPVIMRMVLLQFQATRAKIADR